MRYSWTQPCCVSCWNERNPDRQAAQIKEPYRVREICVYCGNGAEGGIYIRIDPQEAPHPALEKD